MQTQPGERPSHIISHKDIMAQVRTDPTQELHNEIRHLWKIHSIAEDNRDIPGLMSTLTEDCVYEMVTTGDMWVGHAGATEFYTTLLGSFPDIKFHLTDIVVGPQGVCEEAFVLGTHEKDWLKFKATGKLVEFRVAIFFPWDPVKRKFKGEKMYVSYRED